MAYALFKFDHLGNPINSTHKHFLFDDEWCNMRPEVVETRPTSLGPKYSDLEFAKVEMMLNHITADCHYEDYRNIIWALESTNWILASELQYNWSITAPHRFNQHCLDGLIESYKPGHFTYGTLIMYAKNAGWNETKWQHMINELNEQYGWENFMTSEEKFDYLILSMTGK